VNANTVEIVLKARDAASAVVSVAMSRVNRATRAYNGTLQQFNGQVKSSVQAFAGFAAQAVSVASVPRALPPGIRCVSRGQVSGWLNGMEPSGDLTPLRNEHRHKKRVTVRSP